MFRIFATFIMGLLCSAAWASDTVLVGYYLHALDSAEYKAIAEYEGDKILSLEIDVKGTGMSKHTALVLEGENKIESFHNALVKFYNKVSKLDKTFENQNIERLSHPINLLWPTVKLAGVLQGAQLDYEMYDVCLPTVINTYYVYEYFMKKIIFTFESACPNVFANNYYAHYNNKGELIGLINNPKAVSLQACIINYDLGNISELIQLTDPSFIHERIRLKNELLNKKRQ